MAKSISLTRKKHHKDAAASFVEGNSDNDARLTVDLPSDLHKQFKVWAVQNDKKMNEILREHIRELVGS